MTHYAEDSDLLDGCDIDFALDPTTDEELPYEVLFAGVKERHGIFGRLKHHEAIEEKADQWVVLFGQPEEGDT